LVHKDIGQNCTERTQTRHVPTDDQHQNLEKQQNINETTMSTGPGTSTQSGDGIQQTPGCLVSPLSAYPLCRVKGTPLYPTGTKNSNFVEDHPRNIPAKFGSNRPTGFGEEA
jgi:hypothetical protein